MKNYKTFFLSVFLMPFMLNAQAPPILWERSFGGSGDEQPKCIQQTTDGGYMIAGSATSGNGDLTGNKGMLDAWIVKLDQNGSLVWQQNFGGSQDDEANSIQQTTDGGYIIAGYSKSSNGDLSANHGNADYWLIKLNASGTIQWQKSYGGSAEDIANSVQQTSDGGYIVTGNTKSSDGDISSYHANTDFWIIKINNSGTLQWQKTLGGSGLENSASVLQTTDGSYIVAGSTASIDGDVTPPGNGFKNYWIIKLTGSGTVQWQKSYGGTNSDEAMSIYQTTDHGYIIGGYTMSNNGDVTGYAGSAENCWIIKTDSTGSIQWQKPLGGGGGEIARSVYQTSDNGYVFTGPVGSNDLDVSGNHGCRDVWVVKLHNSGLVEWKSVLGGSGCEDASSVIQSSDGGYVIAASSSSNDGNVTGNHGGSDFWIVKLASVLNVKDIDLQEAASIFPNPSTGKITIEKIKGNSTIAIFDVHGNLILKQTVTTKGVIDLTGYTKGVYFYEIINSDQSAWRGKIMLSE